MISFFYGLTIARFHSSTNIFYKAINIILYAEYLLMNKICDLVVKYVYPRAKKELNQNQRKERIIISFTTIPSRVSTLCVSLKSIFNQTMMPDKIILWITEEEKDKGNIEKILSAEIDKGLEIRYVHDVRVHTKYYYAMKEFPNDLIVTIDDDILYPENLIEELWKAHNDYPNMIIAQRAHEMTFCDGKIDVYKHWKMLAPGCKNDNKNLIATGVGGVLYPPNSLYKDWIKPDLFLKICPFADDIWLKIMEILNDTFVYKVHKYTKENFIIGNTQTIALSKQNVNGGRNDTLLNNCIQYYGLDLNNEKK